MKLYSLLPILSGAMLITQCAPESMLNPTPEVGPQEVIPVGPDTAFVNNPAGSRLDYQDDRKEYTYRLKQSHIYQFGSITKKRKKTETSVGVWMYKKTGPKTGQLIFDGRDTWNLRFISKNRATAKNETTGRTRTFNFEWE